MSQITLCGNCGTYYASGLESAICPHPVVFHEVRQVVVISTPPLDMQQAADFLEVAADWMEKNVTLAGEIAKKHADRHDLSAEDRAELELDIRNALIRARKDAP